MELVATTVFEKNLNALNGDKRYIINQGAARSSKSHSLIQIAIYLALTKNNTRISIVRKTLKSLRNGMMKEFFDYLKEINLYNINSHSKSENYFIFPNGSRVEFLGVDTENAVRGLTRDYLIVDEANAVFKDDWDQLVLRTKEKVFAAYNPSDNQSFLYDLPADEIEFIVSTYHDNPFITPSQIKYLENLRLTDPDMYQIYALGQRVSGTREHVYTNWEFMDYKPKGFDKNVLGIDYGFTDPTTCLRVWYNSESELFVEELFYKSNLDPSQIEANLIETGVTIKDILIAETARPEINSSISSKNIAQVIKADKSISAGIDALRRKKVYTNSKNLWSEYESYKWKKVQGIVTDTPTGRDHALDALRYANHYIHKYLESNQTNYAFSL